MVNQSEQHITMAMANENGLTFFITAIYASCLVDRRRQLFDELLDFSYSVNTPWLVGGDFNCVALPSEKLGGSSVNLQSMMDFNAFSSAASLSDAGYIGCSEGKAN
ncbi:hypothetical protein Taro_041182 [Colocasia esculenta]|uniref:Endonuclease/exonuclease/phosphatase domain-containing protein n=1 Tax=Colocasia esculenta TaxID=4460 RepID=A0A843WKU9_COLES|nr:hypothetical protein [Colocasia esculenta]